MQLLKVEKVTIINLSEKLVGSEIIIKAIVEALGVCRYQLKSPVKKQRICDARFIGMRFMRNNKIILRVIGNHFNRDHTTVLAGLKQYNNLYDTDPIFRAKVNIVAKRINELSA